MASVGRAGCGSAGSSAGLHLAGGPGCILIQKLAWGGVPSSHLGLSAELSLLGLKG